MNLDCLSTVRESQQTLRRSKACSYDSSYALVFLDIRGLRESRKTQYIGENDNLRKTCYTLTSTQTTAYLHSPTTNAHFPQCKLEKTAQIHTEDRRRLKGCKNGRISTHRPPRIHGNIDSTREGKFKKTQSVIRNMIFVN